ncbi:MAG: homoserine dehydrogenase [Kiritimatiellae bacterium]|nr:homoserine dehydrogenase [Kiritimatiellia bacterium]MDD5522109.1 homoserine dehydrogenase [Kiritimatiellia bacterium]
MKEIGIGLLGFGTVGAGVVEELQKNGEIIANRLGVKPVLRKIADIELDRDRGVNVDRSILTKDADLVINDPSVSVIVELIGGTGIARKLMMQALKLGKPVITANKALLAEHGAEIFKQAAEKKTDVWFEASVGGGIPIIRSLREGLIANKIDRMYGILNGTCNYILSSMDREQVTFEHALKNAQMAGYAESDPALDIDGIDTAHKAVILASLAYGFPVPMSAVYVEGIRGVSKTDIENARGMGYRLKLLAVIKNEGGEVEVHVHPTLIPAEQMLSSVSGVFNAVVVEGDVAGQTLYYGRGAGRYPTASAVISDIADVCRELAFGDIKRRHSFGWQKEEVKLKEMGRIETRYYLRVSLLDKPGMLGRLATILGQHQISIASVLQKERHAGKQVPIVIVTDRARESDFEAAVKNIDAMDVVGAKTVRIRIEDLV